MSSTENDYSVIEIIDSDSDDERELIPMMTDTPIPSETNTHLPLDIIVHICKFLPPEYILDTCTVNRDWFEACLDDEFWLPFLPSWKISRLPSNMKRGDLRKLVIKDGKENSKARIFWKHHVRWEKTRYSAYQWMNANTDRAVDFTVFCVFIGFVVFIFIMALRDVNTSIAVHALTSLWFAYVMLFSLWVFFTIARCCVRGPSCGVVIYTVLFAAVSVQMIMVHLKLGNEYIMSWFAVLSPTYLVLVVWFLTLCFELREFLSPSVLIRVIVPWIMQPLQLTITTSLVFSVLVAVVGDGYMHIAIAFIPLYVIETFWIYYYVRKEKEMKLVRRAAVVSLLLSLMLCEILLSLREFLHSFAWFAWLLPVAIASLIMWTRGRGVTD